MTIQTYPTERRSTGLAIAIGATILSLGALAMLAQVDEAGDSCSEAGSEVSAMTCKVAIQVGKATAAVAKGAMAFATERQGLAR
jgi:hypothetical protein